MPDLLVPHIVSLRLTYDLAKRFDESPFRGKGDMERIRNSRQNPMTFTRVLDLKFAWLSCGYCTCSH